MENHPSSLVELGDTWVAVWEKKECGAYTHLKQERIENKSIIMSQRYAKRLQRELKDIQKSPPVGMVLYDVSNLDKYASVGRELIFLLTFYYRWIMLVQGAEETIYAGEQFFLQFKFNTMYPMESPEVWHTSKAFKSLWKAIHIFCQVIFIGDHIPIHPHIYSNGHVGFKNVLSKVNLSNGWLQYDRFVCLSCMIIGPRHLESVSLSSANCWWVLVINSLPPSLSFFRCHLPQHSIDAIFLQEEGKAFR